MGPIGRAGVVVTAMGRLESNTAKNGIRCVADLFR